VRLYLSAFRMGDHTERLLGLIPAGASVSVITNACDAYPVADRQAGVQRELSALDALGLNARELDLRAFFGDRRGVERKIDGTDLLWVRGGNTFLLRHALAESGADAVIAERLRGDAVVYGGYSAGVCVLGPTLRGLERSPASTERVHKPEGCSRDRDRIAQVCPIPA
jgi:dipeptidase E